MRTKIIAAAIILLALAGCESYITEPNLSIWPPQITETDEAGNVLDSNQDWCGEWKAGDNVKNAFADAINAGEQTFFGPAYPNPQHRVDFVETAVTIPIRHHEILRIIITDMKFRVMSARNFRADGGGGFRWVLRDRRGEYVPAGFYKVFIEELNSKKIICSGTIQVK